MTENNRESRHLGYLLSWNEVEFLLRDSASLPTLRARFGLPTLDPPDSAAVIGLASLIGRGLATWGADGVEIARPAALHAVALEVCERWLGVAVSFGEAVRGATLGLWAHDRPILVSFTGQGRFTIAMYKQEYGSNASCMTSLVAAALSGGARQVVITWGDDDSSEWLAFDALVGTGAAYVTDQVSGRQAAPSDLRDVMEQLPAFAIPLERV